MTDGKVRKSDAEWRALLSEEQHRIAREGATEPAFTGKYHQTKTPGVYVCVCCRQALFDSEAKYDSGSGWPSFQQPIDSEGVEHIEDRSHGMIRVEVRCSRCDAHLGHVFPDGPGPDGRRFCINSACLDLEQRESGETS